MFSTQFLVQECSSTGSLFEAHLVASACSWNKGVTEVTEEEEETSRIFTQADTVGSADYGSTYTKVNLLPGTTIVVTSFYICPTNKKKVRGKRWLRHRGYGPAAGTRPPTSSPLPPPPLSFASPAPH
ncbi:hypothetical protein D4764_03G0007530 [Takifugu flavidus]|uniref:Uncharacterized protein n=1 Tax=Takifugu flavidus TaxID=433684 RepID=A0A5C6N9H0_9TELE|nr:hypothetical protein D4764_03G0007530 [Takifugu flavidus]